MTNSNPLNTFYNRIAVILFTILLISSMSYFYNTGKTIYNSSKVYHNRYEQKVQERQGFYDKLWKTYLQKEKVSTLNKETFVQVSKIIMDGRKDGQNVAWKWVQENQNIPFEEFSSFYKDLSNFVEEQREQYFKLEKECQTIAYQNNTLLDTIPNNIYNKVLKCKHIDFEYGFLSDSTNVVFKNKTENLK